MKDYEKEIAQKYLLPERPFLHGMASAFDLFGVLDGDTLKQIRRRHQVRKLQYDNEPLRSIWLEVGDTLLQAIDRNEKETSGSSST
ncbi:MAG: hypothetical protein OXG60_16460 [Chloroflexi bacterium]|nr:hypothetical protein [Chloroflexota bacterium]